VLARWVHSHEYPPRVGRLGCRLTSLFNNTFDVAIVPADPVKTPAVPKKHGWLPLLTVLFLISYALMTMLIIEQGQTIESQRALIRELFRDSAELSAVKQAQIAKSAAERRSQAPAAKAPSSQVPLTQAPLTQAPLTHAPLTQSPTTQTPSSQAVPQHQVQRNGAKPEFHMPSRPASDLTDENRALVTI